MPKKLLTISIAAYNVEKYIALALDSLVKAEYINELEILVVDEVLAVGDAEFQKKAIGKMQDVSKGEGRTVLFVSHNMAAVRSLCTRGIMLKNGTIDFIGSIPDTLSHYLKDDEGKQDNLIINNIKWKKNTIDINKTKESYSLIKNGQESLDILIEGTSEEEMVYDIMMVLKSKEGIPLATYAKGHYMGDIQHSPKGHFSIHKQVKLPVILTKGIINVDLYIHHPMVEYYFKAPECCILECEGFQKGFGRTMNQDSCGFIGLEDLI